MRAPGTPLDALPLGPGMLGVGRSPDGRLHALSDPLAARACFCVDRRGTWLVVGEGVRGVHVNGRPVQRRALLRGGDTVHLDGAEITLVGNGGGTPHAPTMERPAPGADDPRVVLRGTTGPHHGRSLTLDRPRSIGSAPDADIHIDGLSPRHATVSMEGAQVVLRTVDGRTLVDVNGEPRRSAVLQPGDQVAFDAAHRFVLEAPTPLLGTPVDDTALPEIPLPEPPVDSRPLRFPWLLLAALLIAAGLSALLLL